jgi:hypothetical protein
MGHRDHLPISVRIIGCLGRRIQRAEVKAPAILEFDGLANGRRRVSLGRRRRIGQRRMAEAGGDQGGHGRGLEKRLHRKPVLPCGAAATTFAGAAGAVSCEHVMSLIQA